MVKEYSMREVKDILNRNGFVPSGYQNGSHQKYVRNGESLSIPITGKMLNKMLFRRLVKEFGLVLETGNMK